MSEQLEDSNNDTKGTKVTTRMRLIGGGVAVAAMLLAAAPAGAGGKQTILHGTFSETAQGAAAPWNYDIHGSAKLTVSADGTTARVNVSGLDPAKQYGSHLHNGVCGSADGHYQNVVSSTDVAHGNELHLFNTAAGKLVANRGGVAHATTSTSWTARLDHETLTNARSIVVHEPGGVRIACANLA